MSVSVRKSMFWRVSDQQTEHGKTKNLCGKVILKRKSTQKLNLSGVKGVHESSNCRFELNIVNS